MATRQWHYVQGGRQAGPVAEDVLRRMVDTGAVGPGDLVWTDGFADWQPAGQVPEFAGRSAATAPPIFETENDSPYAAPSVIVTRAEGLAATGRVTYAGFWKRFAASILDSLILFIPSLMMGFMLGMMLAPMGLSARQMESVGNVLGVVIYWLYSAFMESGTSQATFGKMALGIIVTDMQGRRISFARATGRTFAKYVSMLILFIGYIMAGFTAKKQALHDMMAGCLVINKR